MNVLIVYAHPEPTSFSAAMKEAAQGALASAGHTVEISDLYSEGFNPVPGRHDFTDVANPARFHYQTEQLHASKTAGFSADLAREQARLLRADLLVFIFPLWWGGLPAILKGWFDRVCAYGIAYADRKRFDQGYFVGRRAVVALSTGGTSERFSPAGSYGDIREVLYSVQRCILEYLGLEVMRPFVAYGVPRVDEPTRRDYLLQLEARLLEIVGDTAWQARLKAREQEAAKNRADLAENAWSSQR